MNNNLILDCNNLYKHYQQGNYIVEVLKGIDLKINSGELVAIIGSSGSGKSTLLHVLAGLDNVNSGTIILDGKEINILNDTAKTKIRNQSFGFIYQFHHLLPEFTAFENVLMPILIQNDGHNYNDYALELFEKLNIENRKDHLPSQLSGGERQRVAIARALINRPKIIFADEPTGNLDNSTAFSVLELFFELQKETKTAVIMVTHDLDIAKRASICYTLHDGILKNNINEYNRI